MLVTEQSPDCLGSRAGTFGAQPRWCRPRPALARLTPSNAAPNDRFRRVAAVHWHRGEGLLATHCGPTVRTAWRSTPGNLPAYRHQPVRDLAGESAHAVLPELANANNTLSICLSEIGRHEDGNCHQVRSHWQLSRMKQGAARQAELPTAAFAAPQWPASIGVHVQATAIGANRLASRLRPANALEGVPRFLIRHPRHLS
jgi:hypothetical protein